jgi:hypothetical protein
MALIEGPISRLPDAEGVARSGGKTEERALEHRPAFTFLCAAAVLIVGLLIASLEWDRALPWSRAAAEVDDSEDGLQSGQGLPAHAFSWVGESKTWWA